MSTEMQELLVSLFTNPLYGRLIVAAAVVVMFSLFYFVAERLRTAGALGGLRVGKESAALRSVVMAGSRK